METGGVILFYYNYRLYIINSYFPNILLVQSEQNIKHKHQLIFILLFKNTTRKKNMRKNNLNMWKKI